MSATPVPGIDMPATFVPNQRVLDAAPELPKVSLAGREFPIPLLGPRQNRLVLSVGVSLFKRMAPLRMLVAEAQRTGIKPDENALAAAFEMNEQDHIQLENVVYAGLTKAHPDMRKDDFLDAPIATSELMAAFFTIMQQSGGVKPAKPGEEKGETTAASPQTGTN
jgi:hypothetical protein